MIASVMRQEAQSRQPLENPLQNEELLGQTTLGIDFVEDKDYVESMRARVVRSQVWHRDHAFIYSLKLGNEKGFTDLEDYKRKKYSYHMALRKKVAGKKAMHGERSATKYSALGAYNRLKPAFYIILAICIVSYMLSHRTLTGGKHGVFSAEDIGVKPTTVALIQPKSAVPSFTEEVDARGTTKKVVAPSVVIHPVPVKIEPMKLVSYLLYGLSFTMLLYWLLRMRRKRKYASNQETVSIPDSALS